MGCAGSKAEGAPSTGLYEEQVSKFAPTSPPPSAPSEAFGEITFANNVGTYGLKKFRGPVAARYLAKQRLPANTLEDYSWTADRNKANLIAAAVMEWARDNGATMSMHLFQPLGSAIMRLGQASGVANGMFNFGADGALKWIYDGGDLLKGESDGSSFLNGGMRATHTAGGYTAIDPSSAIFIRGDTVYVPTVFVSWMGHALDEKTPLLRSMKAISNEGVRLLSLLGYKTSGIIPNIGLEQEFFLIPRGAYYKRPDLQLAGRTIMGREPPRGQELCDHYMAPLNQLALECMKEIQHEGFLQGIPFKTRHREVAPNQYEIAPFFGIASEQIDQNLTLMQLIDEIAARHGLAGVLHEKPFMGVNGSGKHNNFSLGTLDGVNLFNGPQITAKSGNADLFPIVIAAVIRAVDKHGDLLRMAIASPGNDFRLGACEAPPAIISTYLGAQLTAYLEDFKSGKTGVTYAPETKTVDLGCPGIAPFTVPAEDRNRTSPFPYGGHRFEFRAAGSSQNVSMINTVLCTAIAESFAEFSDKIEAGTPPAKVAAEALEEHWKVIFNGNGYSEEWPIEAGKRGVWRIDSGVEAMAQIQSEKNLALFEKLAVMSTTETKARAEVMFEQYAGTVEIEAKCMIDMINQHVIPSAKKAGLSYSAVASGATTVQASLDKMLKLGDEYAKATAARVLRLEVMEDVRKACDELEGICPPEHWTLASYKDLLFLDANQARTPDATPA